MPIDSSSNSRRRWLGIAVAAVLACLAYAFPLPGVSEEARRLTAVIAVVATLWIAETIPLATTALLGPALAVLTGVAPAERAFAALGNPILMLFIGSFLLGRAIFKHRLNERIAYRVLSLGILQSDPTRAFVFLGLTTAVISAWMSNTATAAMMLPIGQSILVAMAPAGGAPPPQVYAAGIVLIVAYSASLGGLFTPVGTPPNLIGLGLIEQATGERISFVTWLVDVFPVILLCLALMMAYFAWLFRREKTALVYDRARMVERHRALGPWSRAERSVGFAFLATVALWIVPPLLRYGGAPGGAFLAARLPETVVPLVVTGCLFFARGERGRTVLDVGDLMRIDWPVILLFGGGMCLGDLVIGTGLAEGVGKALAAHLPAGDSPLLVLAFCVFAIAVSEATSNTASANMVVPVVVAVTSQIGGNAAALGLAATVACTFGFMLPVSTPTNAMAYATGYVTQAQMIRYGALLDLAGVLLLSAWFAWVV